MSRKVFYSFHYKRDAWRAGQVRNCNAIADEDEYGVIDAVEWETIERAGAEAIKRWINEQLQNTSVTAVLIGAETSEREWVNYEIRRSWERGNALVGIRIHGIKDQDCQTDSAGKNPFDNIFLKDGTALSLIFKTYDWDGNDGRENMTAWVEEAFQIRQVYKGELSLKEGKGISTSQPIPSQQSFVKKEPTIIKNPSAPWAH